MPNLSEKISTLNEFAPGIASKLNTLASTKKNIADAIEDRDVPVPEGASFFSYGDLIRQIKGKPKEKPAGASVNKTPTTRTGHSSTKSGYSTKGLTSKYIKANGTYNAADEKVKGWSSVTVNVDAPKDVDQDSYTVRFINAYVTMQEALDFMLSDIRECEAKGETSNFFSNRGNPYINTTTNLLMSYSSYTQYTPIPRTYTVVKELTVKKGGSVTAADIPELPNTRSIDYFCDSYNEYSDDYNNIWVSNGSNGYKSRAERSATGWAQINNTRNYNTEFVVSRNMDIYAYYGAQTLTSQDTSLSEDDSSNEISDSWETIAANKGANYPVGSFKYLYPEKKVLAYDVLTVQGKTTKSASFTSGLKITKVKGPNSEDGSTSTWVLESGFMPQGVTWSGMWAWTNRGINGQDYDTFAIPNAPKSDIPFNKRSWAKSYIREFLNTAMLNVFPEVLRNAILPVNKYTFERYFMYDWNWPEEDYVAETTRVAPTDNSKSLTFKTNRYFPLQLLSNADIMIPNYLTVDKLWLLSSIEYGKTLDNVVYGYMSGGSRYGTPVTKGSSYDGLYANGGTVQQYVLTRDGFVIYYKQSGKSNTSFVDMSNKVYLSPGEHIDQFASGMAHLKFGFCL